jgi:DNA-binding beta-propeller fold protein YncE
MALDAERGHLFVAEYGNGSLDEIDLASGKVFGSISGLHGPQGVAWLPQQQEIAVASSDGLVTFYRGADRQPVGIVRLGDDADNVRVDSRNGNLVVGYGSGALAVIDSATHQVIRQMRLPAHPEAFELFGAKVFVNVPDAHEIAVGDLDQGQTATALSARLRFGNSPMASDGSHVAVAYRIPGTLSVMDAQSGAVVYSTSICDDADDVYFHAGSVIVVCGEGAVELVEQATSHSTVRVATQQGARTGLLDSEHNRLFVAVPARHGPAAVWELSFSPETTQLQP